VESQAVRQLAIEGGPKAFPAPEGKAQPKIGVAEFLSIARRFGFSEAAMRRIADAVSDEDLPEGGPNLARYICANPAPPVGEQFEAKARELFRSRYAIAVSSGTAALHAAMIAVGAGPNMEVICPALGFMATSAAVALTGATPVFCDVDESLQIDPTKIEARITDRTVAVVPTHQWGVTADMDAVMAVAGRCGLKVVEDCAQSPGARFGGRYVGTIGDVGCFSISAYKIIGGSEGGLLLTQDERLHERSCQLAECGGLWRPDRFAPPRYEGELFVGTNYRLSELESAVDVVQLDKLEPLVNRYRRVCSHILEQVAGYRRIRPQKHNDFEGDIGYLIRFFPDTHELAGKIVEALRAEGIGAAWRGPQAKPDWHLYSYMFPVWEQIGGQIRRDCPVADDLYSRVVSLNVSPWWTDADCDAFAAGMNKVFTAYCDVSAGPGAWLAG